MIRSLIPAVTTIFISVSFLSSCAVAEVVPTLDAVIQEIRGSVAGITSLRVSCTITTVVENPALRDQIGRYTDSDEFAYDNTARFYRHRRNWGLDGDGRDQWMEQRLVFDGNRTGSQSIITTPPKKPNVQPAAITPGLKEGSVLQRNLYMEAIGSFHYDGRWLSIWPDQGIAEPAAKFSLPDALTADGYRVLPEFQAVANHQCVVLEKPDCDKLWLDVERGFAVVQREWNWLDSPVMMVRFRNEEFEEKTPGLWLPKRVQCEVFERPEKGSVTQTTRNMTKTCLVATLELNSVDPQLFVISFPKDTPILDATLIEKTETGIPVVEYTAGSTPEETQTHLEEALSHVKSRSPWPRTLLISVNAIVFVALIALVVRLYLRRTA